MITWRENLPKMAASNNRERTVEDVEKILDHARINVKDIRNVTQTLYYGENFIDNDLVLMEVDKSLLEIVSKNSSLMFRGEEDDEVVLCTADQTYLVREAETSNNMLLLPQLRTDSQELNGIDNSTKSLTILPQKIIGSFHTYLELTPVKPALHRLHSLLEKNLYEGREIEAQKSSIKYSFNDLLNIIQASDSELKEGLRKIEAYEIDGFWRMLEFDYQSRVVMHILNYVQENSWELNKVKKQDIVSVLQELEPRLVLEQCLDYYSVDLGAKSEDGQDLLQLREDKICCLFADMILRQAGKFDLKEFLDSWRLSVPEGFKTDLKQLEGLVFIERDRHPQVISRLTVWDLPESVDERFVSLFKIRQKWRCDDIKPFIMDLTCKRQTVDSLLTKYSRISTINNEKFCNAKYC